MRSRILSFAFLLLFVGMPAFADEAPVSYYKQVRRIFVSNCNACHKPEKLKGDLDMTSVAMLLKGGKHAPDVIPGNSSKSSLIEKISGDDPEMPKEGDPLTPPQIALITKWIAQGAVDDTPK